MIFTRKKCFFFINFVTVFTGYGFYTYIGVPRMLSVEGLFPMILTSTTTDKTVVTSHHPQADRRRHKSLYVTPALKNQRLGNEMFLYASSLGIARAQGRKMLMSRGSDLEKIFQLHHVATKEGSMKWKRTFERNPYYFDTNLMKLPPKNFRIYGYLQSFKYFSAIVDEVRQEFTFQDSTVNASSRILHSLRNKYEGSLMIGVHVRRTDFLSDRNQRLGYLVPEKSYFIKAFEMLKSKYPYRNVTFIVASDDLSWCKKSLVRNDVVILPPAPPGIHMAILASCDHVIISSGSYGWWAAWLAGGLVVYFKDFMERNTTIGKDFVAQDYYPPFWNGLGN